MRKRDVGTENRVRTSGAGRDAGLDHCGVYPNALEFAYYRLAALTDSELFARE